MLYRREKTKEQERAARSGRREKDQRKGAVLARWSRAPFAPEVWLALVRCFQVQNVLQVQMDGTTKSKLLG